MLIYVGFCAIINIETLVGEYVHGCNQDGPLGRRNIYPV